MSVKPRKRKDGKTVFDVRVQVGRIRVSRTVPTTMTEARRVESKILQELLAGKYEILTQKENPRFKEYAAEYLKTVTWQKSYKLTVMLVKSLAEYFGEKRLSEITTQDFLAYRGMRLGQVSHASINRAHSCLLRMLNLAIQDDRYLISRNPLQGIKRLKEPPAEDRVLTREEYHQLLEAAPGYFRRILFFACHTGLRKMEILSLTFGQLKMYISAAENGKVALNSGQ